MAIPSARDQAINHYWEALAQNPRFQRLVKRKQRFLGGLMLLSLTSYFLLPIAAGYYPDLLRTQIAGGLNLALIFGFAEFVMTCSIAWWYGHRASREFDALTKEVIATAPDFYEGPSHG